MLKEYFELGEQIKALEAARAALKEKIVARGTHSSREFICSVSSQSRRSISLTDIEKKNPNLCLSLTNEGFVKEIIVTIVKVTPKAA